MGDKGEGRVKFFKKWVTSFMDKSLVYFSRCQGFLPFIKSKILTRKPSLSEKTQFFVEHPVLIMINIATSDYYLVQYLVMEQGHTRIRRIIFMNAKKEKKTVFKKL